MAQIKDLSLRKTLLLYLCIALICSFFTSYIILANAEKVQKNVWYKYCDMEKYAKAEKIGANENFIVTVMRPSAYVMTKNDHRVSETCDAVNTWTPLILSTLSAALAVFLFYENKLKKPIKILEEGSNRIAENSLDFHVDYDLEDEMGRLCSSFEHMRMQLDLNNKNLWKMIDEQKNLKAAIAHDMRAPMAVLKGYHEMLLEFVPQNKIDQKKLLEIIEAGNGQVDRLAAFVDTMKQLSSLEDRKVISKKISTLELTRQLKETASILTENIGVDCGIFVDTSVPKIFIGDLSILHEVYENLLTNAIRFTSDMISVVLEACGNKLQLTVSDNGTGFKKENLPIVTKAYYHDNPVQSADHYGLGLYICKMLCEKHGGMLSLANNSGKGACVKAVFEIHSSDNSDT